MDFLFEAFTFDLRQTVVDFLRVGLAFLLAIPIGWERHESEGSSDLGLRTFPIVAIGSCAFMLIAKDLSGADAASQARLIQGLIGGIGFIGGGAILKHGTNVRGLATAASIWCTGAIGAAVAFEREEIAVILSAVMFVTLRTLTPVVKNGDSDEETDKNEE